MSRSSLWATLALLALTAALSAQDGPQRGKIKKIDADKGVLTVTADGADRDLHVQESTRFMGPGKVPLEDGLKNPLFKEGAAVMFLAAVKDGKSYLRGVFVPGGKDLPKKGFPGKDFPKVDVSRFKPLPELGTEEYQGFKGGLYGDGKNERPAAHEAAGLALAKAVRPLDADGKPAADGKIVLLSVGMSNTTQVFSAFKRLADADADKNPRLVVVDGAQGGMSAGRIMDPESGSGAKYWAAVDRRLEQAGVTRAQVQAAWIKQADPGPSQGFPRYARELQSRLAKIVELMHARFPNLKLVYLSSRTYAGYARSPLNPEPYAYESGFSVQWLIGQQLKGDAALNYDPAKGKVTAPWLSWGPYLWARGTTKNSEGLSYAESDFESDGTHPSPSGQQKVARALLRFFKNDTTTRGWFLCP